MKGRILMGLAGVLLLLMFLFPMWRITLIAPQYPDGLTMHIWVNQITGDEPGTLENINLMNHYVGMKDIEPSMFPELEIFPIVIYIVSALAFLFAFLGRRSLYLAWTGIMSVLGVVGVYDFYTWLYNYGHELNPHAAIKVPGQAYMPPVFGYKKLLNFHVWSYPEGASFLLAGAVALGVLAWYLSRKK
ncbi:MAG: hypothetical protein KAH10_02415 [Flavobacteriales bacterium]|nr:hypothetical protein [Flavobacteriales bacterium]